MKVLFVLFLTAVICQVAVGDNLIRRRRGYFNHNHYHGHSEANHEADGGSDGYSGYHWERNHKQNTGNYGYGGRPYDNFGIIEDGSGESSQEEPLRPTTSSTPSNGYGISEGNRRWSRPWSIKGTRNPGHIITTTTTSQTSYEELSLTTAPEKSYGKGNTRGSSLSLYSLTTKATTSAPTTIPSPSELKIKEDLLALCIRTCPVTAEYNPVCGSNNITYANPGRLECEQKCGSDVTLTRLTACSVPEPISTTRRPINREKLVACLRKCPYTAEFNPVCGSNNVTYENPGRLICERNCGIRVELIKHSPCEPEPITTEKVLTKEEQIANCIKTCSVTGEYNPVCGSNNVTYSNPGRLECAQNCGAEVSLSRYTSCNVPADERLRNDQLSTSNIELGPILTTTSTTARPYISGSGKINSSWGNNDSPGSSGDGKVKDKIDNALSGTTNRYNGNLSGNRGNNFSGEVGDGYFENENYSENNNGNGETHLVGGVAVSDGNVESNINGGVARSDGNVGININRGEAGSYGNVGSNINGGEAGSYGNVGSNINGGVTDSDGNVGININRGEAGSYGNVGSNINGWVAGSDGNVGININRGEAGSYGNVGSNINGGEAGNYGNVGSNINGGVAGSDGNVGININRGEAGSYGNVGSNINGGEAGSYGNVGININRGEAGSYENVGSNINGGVTDSDDNEGININGEVTESDRNVGININRGVAGIDGTAENNFKKGVPRNDINVENSSDSLKWGIYGNSGNREKPGYHGGNGNSGNQVNYHGNTCNNGDSASLNKVMACMQLCTLTSEYNPVCGNDGITYTNPGRLLCAQFCGIDVRVKKFAPCSSQSMTNFPCVSHQTQPDCSAVFTNPPVTDNPVTTPKPAQTCMESCTASSVYKPVCGSNNVTYRNKEVLQCARRCGVAVSFESDSECSLKPSTAAPPVWNNDNISKTPTELQECINRCSVEKKYDPICGSDNVTYNNTGHLICARQCGIDVSLRKLSPCINNINNVTPNPTPDKSQVTPSYGKLNFTIPVDILDSIWSQATTPEEEFELDQRVQDSP